MPFTKDLVTRSIKQCEQAVRTYLGGDRPGVKSTAFLPLPTDWRTGNTTMICYAVTEHPVTGPMGRR